MFCFQSVETLAAVYTWIEMNRTDEPQHHYPFSLMTPFPRKVYDGEDREAPLKSLGIFIICISNIYSGIFNYI